MHAIVLYRAQTRPRGTVLRALARTLHVVVHAWWARHVHKVVYVTCQSTLLSDVATPVGGV